MSNDPVQFIDSLGLAPNSDPAQKYNPKKLPKIETYKPPESTGDKIIKKLLDQAVKQATGIGGLVTKSPLGVGISSMVFSKSLNKNEREELERLLKEREEIKMCPAR